MPGLGVRASAQKCEMLTLLVLRTRSKVSLEIGGGEQSPHPLFLARFSLGCERQLVKFGNRL